MPTIISLLMLYMLVKAEVEPPTDNNYQLLQNFLDNIDLITMDTYVTVGVIGIKTEIAQWFLSERVQMQEAVLIWNEERAEVPDHPTYRTKNLFGFVDHITKFKNYLVYLDDCTFLHRRGHYHFIIAEPVEEDSWLREIVEIIWEHFRILNFVIAYNLAGTLKIASYNPFNETVYYLNESEAFFPNKLQNMYGYAFKASMVEIAPITWKEGDTFYGEDVDVLKTITREMNATYMTIEVSTHTRAKQLVIDEKVDFAFVKFVVISEIYDVGYSYPINLEPVVVIIPKSDMLPAYLYILYIFKPLSWLCICFFAIVFLLLNLSSKIIIRRAVSFYIVLLMWIAFIVIIPSAFTSGLTSTLTKPKYEEEIDTIKDLIATDYKIFSNDFIYSILVKKLPQIKNRFFELSQKETATRVIRGDTNVAFSDTYEVVKELLRILEDRGQRPYHLITEKFLPGFTSYAFPFRSPYTDEIEMRIQHLFQCRSNTLKAKPPQTGGHQNLHFVHLQSIFVLLLVGYILSCLMFISEMIIFKRKRLVRRIKKLVTIK